MSYFKEFIFSIWIITCGLVVCTSICTSCADKTIEYFLCILCESTSWIIHEVVLVNIVHFTKYILCTSDLFI